MTERLSVIAGCMFSGKSLELTCRFILRQHASLKGQAFKASIDNRYGKPDKIVVHPRKDDDGFQFSVELPAIAIPVERPSAIFDYLKPETQFVVIDEVQFFAPEIVNVVQKLLAKNIQVIVAGLPNDFRGEPFGSMPWLLALADEITRLAAVCKFIDESGEQCKTPATRTQRLINGQPANYNDPVILVGGKESYTARCIKHHLVPGKPEP